MIDLLAMVKIKHVSLKTDSLASHYSSKFVMSFTNSSDIKFKNSISILILKLFQVYMYSTLLMEVDVPFVK